MCQKCVKLMMNSDHIYIHALRVTAMSCLRDQTDHSQDRAPFKPVLLIQLPTRTLGGTLSLSYSLSVRMKLGSVSTFCADGQ